MNFKSKLPILIDQLGCVQLRLIYASLMGKSLFSLAVACFCIVKRLIHNLYEMGKTKV